MAGIGFELNRLFKRNSFFSDIYAIFYSANVVAGPWIMSSATLLLIQVLLPVESSKFLSSALIYTFIFSTLVSGAVSTAVVRFLSDLLYKREYEKVYPLYLSAVRHVVAVIGIYLLGFLLINYPIEPMKFLLFSHSMVLLTVIWVQLCFITTIRKFSPVVVAFLTGSLTSLFLSLTLHRAFGEEVAYLGYNVGLVLIGVILGAALKRGTDTSRHHSKAGGVRRSDLFKVALKTYKTQVVTGFLTYLAAWIDDFYAWWHFRHEPARGFIFAPEYDLPMFVSYIFIIPTLVLFVVNLETDFYESYRVFYRSIEENRTLRFINVSKKSLDENLRYATRVVLSTQVSVSLMGLVLSNELASWLGMSEYSTRALRFGLVGAAANGLFLFFSLIAYYFDLPGVPLKGAALAFFVNASVSPFTLAKFPGLGFSLGFVVATFYVVAAFRKIYSQLLRYEFNRTKLNLPKRETVVHERGESVA